MNAVHSFFALRVIVNYGKQRTLAALGIICAIFLLPVGQSRGEQISSGAVATNPHILPRGQAVLDYISAIGAEKKRRILSGQWVSSPSAWPDAYEIFVESLSKATGKQVAILGSDYFGSANVTPEQNRRLDEILIRHWKAGGLVTLTWSAENPWYEGHSTIYCRNVPKPCVLGKLTDLTRPETASGARFQSEMDELASDLGNLQRAGVIVLFRPFHEMNGSWFWWGVRSVSSPSQSEFVDLWKYTYRYLTDVKKLNNLLWIFSPVNSETGTTVYPSWNGIIRPAPYYYPGNEYVDITGIDVYNDRFTSSGTEATEKARDYSIPTYSQMIALGKPFGLAEFGPGDPKGKKFDFDGMLHIVANEYQKVAFFMAWQDDPGAHKYFSIIHNLDAKRLMNDPMIITRSNVN